MPRRFWPWLKDKQQKIARINNAATTIGRAGAAIALRIALRVSTQTQHTHTHSHVLYCAPARACAQTGKHDFHYSSLFWLLLWLLLLLCCLVQQQRTRGRNTQHTNTQKQHKKLKFYCIYISLRLSLPPPQRLTHLTRLHIAFTHRRAPTGAAPKMPSTRRRHSAQIYALC